ncbi:hypothetical protein BDW22DRAFT_1346726 [Trametopsis cervina]|nr:hypothetical protein BDW22DRAFT_1346726 [Trametopsis cervina]
MSTAADRSQGADLQVEPQAGIPNTVPRHVSNKTVLNGHNEAGGLGVSHVASYRAIPAKGDSGRTAALAKFWETVIDRSFWREFTVEDARSTMTSAANASESEVISAMNESIKSWYRRHASDTKGGGRNDPWSIALKGLRKAVEGPPKRMAGWQMYLNQNTKKINDIFTQEKDLPENTKKQGIHLRSEIARRLLKEADAETQEAIQKAIDSEFEESTRQQEHLAQAQADDPEVQANARRRLAPIVTPLLKLISEATGLQNITLLGGTAPSSPTEKYLVSVVHYGTTAEPVPKDFFDFDRDGFRLNVLGQFCKFLGATKVDTPAINTEDLLKNIEIQDTDEDVVPEVVESSAAASNGEQSTSQPPNDIPRPQTRSTSGTAKTTPSPHIVNKPAAQEKTLDSPSVLLRVGAGTALMRKLNAMESSEREREIMRLNALSDLEFQGENLSATMQALDGDIPSAAGTRRPKPRPTLQPHAESATNIPSAGELPAEDATCSTGQVVTEPREELSLDRDDTGSTEDAEGSSTLTPHNRPESPSSNSLPTIPGWIQDHRDRFLASPMLDSLKQSWCRIVSNWILIEAALDYQTPAKGFAPERRPREISIWIQNARRNGVVIKPERHNGFRNEWLAWWDSLNPDWRERQAGRLVIGGAGDWSELFRPGKCGFLLILESLLGLQVAAPVEDLIASINDVDWVLIQVLTALSARGKRAIDEDDEENHSRSPSPVVTRMRKRVRRA